MNKGVWLGSNITLFTKNSSSGLAHMWEFAPIILLKRGEGKGKPWDRTMVRNALGGKQV